MIDERVLATVARPDVLRLSPPLIASDDDVDRAAAAFGAALVAVGGSRRVSGTNGAVKAKRQQAILALVSREHLGSQEEIRATSADDGHRGHAIDDQPRHRGARTGARARARRHPLRDARAKRRPRSRSAMLRRLLDEFALSFVRAEHGLIVRTPPGAAAALAEGIDRVGLTDVAGTIAGDNTILILGREGVKPARLERSLNRDHGGRLMTNRGGARLQRRAGHVGHDPVAGRAGVRGHAVAVDVGQQEDFARDRRARTQSRRGRASAWSMPSSASRVSTWPARSRRTASTSRSTRW